MFKIVPDAVSGQTIYSLGPGDRAREAARMMAEHDISAVLIVDPQGALIGVVTERDLSRRVVARGLDPDETDLGTIMTPAPRTVAPDASTHEALEIMRLGGYRHLPVVAGGEIVGMVSMRDLRHAIARGLKRDPAPGWLSGLRRRFARS